MAMMVSPRLNVPERKAVQRGFTLIELISVIVVLSIMGAVILPRFMGRSAFDTFGFSEATAGMLRYGQKSAIAKRRTVCISQVGSAVVMTYAAAADVHTCTLNHPDPENGQNYSQDIPSGISVTGLATPLRFNAFGQPVNSSGTVFGTQQDIVINGEFVRHIYVEGETGYVH